MAGATDGAPIPPVLQFQARGYNDKENQGRYSRPKIRKRLGRVQYTGTCRDSIVGSVILEKEQCMGDSRAISHTSEVRGCCPKQLLSKETNYLNM